MDTSSATTSTTTNKAMSEEKRRRLIDSIPEVPTVDACKENIQPRKNGRSVAALTTLFDVNPNEREHALTLGHAKFGELLDNLEEEDDPLDIYIQYIAWTHQMYPQGGCDNLLSLLKDATERFKNDTRYKVDPRYLKIWVEYAQWIEDPKEIFLFLIHSGIGQNLALFYEEYAAYYETFKKNDEAIQVYELGIEREVVPLKRLKKNFTLLKARIEERKQKGLLKRQQQEAKIQMESLKATGQRTMLGQKFDSKSRASVAANVYSGIEASHSSGAASSSSSSFRNSSRTTFGNDRAATATVPTSPSSSSFSVYRETTPTSSPTHLSSQATKSILPNRRTHSSHQITTSNASRSENRTVPVEKFSGSTIPQVDIIRQQSFESFQVYQDDQKEQKEHRPVARSQSALSISSGGESTISKIKRNPTGDHYVNSNKRSRYSNISNSTFNVTNLRDDAQQELESRFNARKKVLFLSTDTGGKPEYISMLSKFVDDRADVSIEEYRAMKLNIPITRRKEEDFKVEKEEEEKGQDSFSAYNRRVMRGEPLPREYTTETRAAMEIVGELFDEKAAYTEEEQDLTWNNPIQKFNTIKRRPGNEN